jgi:hypothetical protein
MFNAEMAYHKFTNMEGKRVKVSGKKMLATAFKTGRVGMYKKATPQNRCRAGFRARKGSTTCKKTTMVHYKKDRSLDMRYNSSWK